MPIKRNKTNTKYFEDLKDNSELIKNKTFELLQEKLKYIERSNILDNELKILNSNRIQTRNYIIQLENKINNFVKMLIDKGDIKNGK